MPWSIPAFIVITVALAGFGLAAYLAFGCMLIRPA